VEIFYIINVNIIWILLFLFILYNGKLRQNSTCLEKNLKDLEIDNRDKYVAIDVKKIFELNRYIEKLTKELEQKCKNIPSVIIKLVSKNNYLE
jgi:hypothetical protein